MNDATAQGDLFRTLFETAPDATIVVDRSGRIVLANAQAEALFGRSPGSLAGEPVEVLLPTALRGGHVAHRERYMANPRLRPMGAGFELVGQRLDGSEFPVEISLSPVQAGANPLYAASIRDISETRRARQALARARYDAAVAEAGRIALESRAVESLLPSIPGMVAGALGIDGAAVLLSAQQRAGLQVQAALGVPAALQDALPDLLARDDEGQALRAAAVAAGLHRTASVPLHGRYGADGVLLAFAAESSAFDRDQLHFLQSISNLLSAALQRRHSEEQLAHAQRLEAIGQLTGGVAHDFNNLLTVISGNLQLLQDGFEGAEREQIVQGAMRAVANGAALTRKLLAFARRQRLTPRTIALAEWLADLHALLRRTLGEGITVSIRCPAAIPAVYADPGELDAALVNLALNARDAMPRGGNLEIEADELRIDADGDVADLAAGHYVIVSVADTGTGMPADVLARALEPFFTTKDAGRGSGLGLSMVYGFARQSGGSMTIASELGYGTRVALYLPVASHGVSPTPALAATTARGGKVVLVVEDEPEVRGIAVAFMRALGHATRVADNGEDALALLREDPSIEFLFTDVVLGGGINGIELAREARQLRPGLPVLLTSGYERTGEDLDDPRLPLLRKPYRREALAEAIDSLFDRDVRT
ncbi:MAG: PAS domain S-box protein [Dokdonella sp.]|uniref:PAS domain S-box protein n=1 Tax=Dokdonella sp. TaxID=2291710 RepID=UPI003F7D314B